MRTKPLLFLALLAAPALAQEGALQLEQFEPRPPGAGLLGVSHPTDFGFLDWGVDAWLNYTREPLTLAPVLEDDPRAEGAVVADRLRLELLGAVGVFRGLSVGGALPFARSFDEGEYSFAGREADDFQAWALGDARLHVDLAPLKMLLGLDHFLGLDVGLALTAWLPTGDEASLEGEGNVRFEPRVNVSYTFWFLKAAADVGYLLRAREQVFSHEVDDAVRWGVAAEAELPFDLAVTAAAFGAVNLADALDAGDANVATDDVSDDPAEIQASLRWRLPIIGLHVEVGVGRGLTEAVGSPAWRLITRVGYRPEPDARDADGDGVPDGPDVCPLEPENLDGVRDEDGCPEGEPPDREPAPPPAPPPPLAAPTDRDEDGILDADDQCPDEPEDKDGNDDEDGCPDLDDDRDGVPDAQDKCLKEAEIMNGVADEDGCPDIGPDADGDGVEDALDVCPLEPETKNGVRDADGCPEGAFDRGGVAAPGATPAQKPGAAPAAAPAAAPTAAAPTAEPLPPLPAPIDLDGDGLVGTADACPTVAEDLDGYEDGDGCPDADNDGDGVPDVTDPCPRAAGVGGAGCPGRSPSP